MTTNEVRTDAYKQGYKAYYDYEGSSDDCPYSHDTEHDFWSQWCDGNYDAYCEAEGK